MTFYSSQWRQHRAIRTLSQQWFKSGLAVDQAKIATAHPKPYASVHPFLAITIAILTCLVVAGATSVIVEITDISAGIGGAILSAVIAVVLYLSAVRVINTRKHFHTGIDDGISIALMAAIFALQANIAQALELPGSVFGTYLLLLVATIPCAYLFRTFITIFAALISACGLLASFLFETLVAPPAAANIALLTIATAAYTCFLQFQPTIVKSWYRTSEQMEYALLIALYLPANFVAFKEIASYINRDYAPKLETLMPWYYVETAVVPLVMIGYGFLRTNPIVLRVGVAGLLLSVMAFQYHFFADHLQEFLFISGLLLVALVLFLQKALANGFGPYINRPLLHFDDKDLNLEYLGLHGVNRRLR